MSYIVNSSQKNMTSTDFRSWASSKDHFFSTCDGGDPGTKEEPSIWLMGVEPGWSLADQSRALTGVDAPRTLDESYSVELQLGWPFNRSAFKLLCALDGGSAEEYRDFAMRARPFERGSKGYFKANLFPVPLHTLAAWDEEAIRDTGFDTKAAYQAWLREARFPVVRSYLEEHRPKVLIATGLAHLTDFLTVVRAQTPQQHIITVNGFDKRIYVATDGLVPLVVLPHLSGGSNGLNSDAAIEKAANLILDNVAL